MNTRFVLNLFLVSIVGILIAFVVYEPGHNESQKIALLSDFVAQNIKTLILERDGQQALKAEKIQSRWHIKQPFDSAANSFQINALLNIVNNHSYAQIEAQQHDLKKFGLDKPVVSLRLDNIVLHFGMTDPLNFRRYVLVGKTIHLINDAGYRYLSQDVTKFVSYKVLPDQKKITKIELPGISISKNTVSGNWDMTPENSKVSPDELNKFVQGWQNAQATHIARWPADLARTGKLKKKTINIQFSDNSELALTIVDDSADLVLGKIESHLQYQLAETVKNTLLHPTTVESQP